MIAYLHTCIFAFSHFEYLHTCILTYLCTCTPVYLYTCILNIHTLSYLEQNHKSSRQGHAISNFFWFSGLSLSHLAVLEELSLLKNFIYDFLELTCLHVMLFYNIPFASFTLLYLSYLTLISYFDCLTQNASFSLVHLYY